MTQFVKVEHEGSDLVGTYEFPDDASDKQIKAAINKLLGPKETPPKRKGSSVFEGMVLTAETAEGPARAVGQYGVGMAYLNGTDGVTQSNEIAKIYLKKAADGGFNPAIEILKSLD